MDEYDEQLTWDEAYERFDDEINEFNSTVTILGYDYDPARALYGIDPIAYHYEFSVWADSNNIDTDALIGPDRR